MCEEREKTGEDRRSEEKREEEKGKVRDVRRGEERRSGGPKERDIVQERGTVSRHAGEHPGLSQLVPITASISFHSVSPSSISLPLLLLLLLLLSAIFSLHSALFLSLSLLPHLSLLLLPHLSLLLPLPLSPSCLPLLMM